MSKIDLADFTTCFRADAKGGGGTRDRAAQTFTRLQEFVKKQDWGKASITPANLSSKQLRQFLESRSKAGISPKTIQNEAAHLRRAIRGAGRVLGDMKDAKNNWANERLGVPVAPPKEARAPIREDILEQARATIKPDISAGLGLQEALGLRANEVVCATVFKDWVKAVDQAIQTGKPTAQLKVFEGTKGDKTRWVEVPAERFDKVKLAVQIAINVRGKNDYLINRDSRPQAHKAFKNATRYAGLVGHNSNHGVRRGWAIQQLAHYESNGLSRGEGLARVSVDLGHGDGRGRWVEENYIGKA